MCVDTYMLLGIMGPSYLTGTSILVYISIYDSLWETNMYHVFFYGRPYDNFSSTNYKCGMYLYQKVIRLFDENYCIFNKANRSKLALCFVSHFWWYSSKIKRKLNSY